MALIGMRDVVWAIDQQPLLDRVSFYLAKGERVGLVGRNGSGKTTLLRLLAGEIQPDIGEIWRQQGLTVTWLPQEVPQGLTATVYEVLAAGSDTSPGQFPQHHIERALSQTGLTPDRLFGDLSAGMQRRTLFARAMVSQPDLVLLDEPTNHLDIAAIDWLEAYIKRHVQSLLFVTHDRAFLKNMATRILELDRGEVKSYACDYRSFIQRRRENEIAEAKQQRRFEKKLTQEEAWIRKGIKARRTRNEGRVRALEKMRAVHRQRCCKPGNLQLQVQEAIQTGKLVIEAEHLVISRQGRKMVSDFSTLIMRSDKIGIIGPNGIGKSTLVKTLLKEYAPDSGTVRHGTHLEVAYFDQLRDQLDEEKTVVDNIARGNHFIHLNGRKRHVVGYLQDFLFSPERCRTPVHILSGGEKNRLLLARLFAKPANVLVLDEPTNDLDAETLELLEEQLLEYNGTLLLISHDRAFLNQVVTSTLVFEEDGQIIEYAGGYDDWLRQRQTPNSADDRKTTPQAKSKPGKRKPTKLGYMELRELEELPAVIDTLETEQKTLFEQMSAPDFYKRPKEQISEIQQKLKTVEQRIEMSYARWEALEDKQKKLLEG